MQRVCLGSQKAGAFTDYGSPKKGTRALACFSLLGATCKPQPLASTVEIHLEMDWCGGTLSAQTPVEELR